MRGQIAVACDAPLKSKLETTGAPSSTLAIVPFRWPGLERHRVAIQPVAANALKFEFTPHPPQSLESAIASIMFFKQPLKRFKVARAEPQAGFRCVLPNR